MFSGYSRGDESSSSDDNDGNYNNYQSDGANVYVPPQPQPQPQSVSRIPPSSSATSFGVTFGRKVSLTPLADKRLFIGPKVGRGGTEARKVRVAEAAAAAEAAATAEARKARVARSRTAAHRAIKQTREDIARTRKEKQASQWAKMTKMEKMKKMAEGKALLEEILKNQEEEESMMHPVASTALGEWYFVLEEAVNSQYGDAYDQAVANFLGRRAVRDDSFTLKEVKEQAEWVSLYQSNQFLKALRSGDMNSIEEASRLADIGMGILAEAATKALRFALSTVRTREDSTKSNGLEILKSLMNLEQSPNVPVGLPVHRWRMYHRSENINVFVDILVNEGQTEPLLASALSRYEGLAAKKATTLLDAIVKRLSGLISAQETSLPLNVLATVLASTEAQDGSAYWNRVVDSLNDDEKGFILAQIRRKMAWVEAGTNRDYFRTPSGVTLWNVEQTGLERYIQ